jgi:hypothetical protein
MEYEARRLAIASNAVITNREHPPDFINIKVEELVGDQPFEELDRYAGGVTAVVGRLQADDRVFAHGCEAGMNEYEKVDSVAAIRISASCFSPCGNSHSHWGAQHHHVRKAF